MRARLATRCIVAGAAILLCATGCGGGGGSSSAAAEQRARQAKAAAQLRRAEARQAKLQAAGQEMAGWLLKGQLKSKEHIVEGLESFPESLAKLFSGENHGKLVLKV